MASITKPKKEYDPDDVATPVPEYKKFMALLELPHTLMDGTPSMREAGVKYLPKEQAETSAQYTARLNRSFLFNAFEKAVYTLSGEVFSEEVKLPDDINDELRLWSENIDLSGHNITTFVKEIFEAGLVDGVVHLLIDLPAIDTQRSENGKLLYREDENSPYIPLTLEVMESKGWRPYVVQIKASQLIGWRVRSEAGVTILEQIRIYESTEEPIGKYGVETVERIRVLEPGYYEVFRKVSEKGEEEKWELERSGNTGLDYIPLVTWLIGDPRSQMTTRPPLDDLAYLNLDHWQSYSDQKNILHYARMITYFGKLLDLEANKNPNVLGPQTAQNSIVMGANTLIHGENDNSDLKVVEHSGKAIESGRNDLQDLEEKMKYYGLSLLAGRQPGNLTATGKAIDSAQSDNSLAAWAISLQDVVNTALGIFGDIMQIENAAGSGVTLNTDYKSFLRSMEIREIREAYVDGILPRELVIDEFKRRGVLKNDWDFEDIMLMLSKEENVYE